MQEIFHLVSRFFGSLDPREPSGEDIAWAHSFLLVKEQAIWQQLSAADRRHSIAVTKKVVAMGKELSVMLSREHIAASLLHDCGKLVSNLGTFQRAFATIALLVVPAAQIVRWQESASGARLRVAQYRLHPELGSKLLAAAGSDTFTQRWTLEHHKPPEKWTIDRTLGTLLKDCDDD